MRRWTPRQPSPELRARIFGVQAPVQIPVQAAARTLGDFSRWLVPAFGCFLLVVGGLSQRVSDPLGGSAETNWLGAQSGGNSRIMLAQSRQHSEINAIPATRMERSIGRAELAQPGRTATSHTNQLIQQ